MQSHEIKTPADTSKSNELIQQIIKTSPQQNETTQDEKEVYEQLIKAFGRVKSIGIQAQDSTGRTPLMVAVFYKNLYAVKWLLKKHGILNDLCLNAKDNNGWTALRFAMEHYNKDIFELLAKQYKSRFELTTAEQVSKNSDIQRALNTEREEFFSLIFTGGSLSNMEALLWLADLSSQRLASENKSHHPFIYKICSQLITSMEREGSFCEKNNKELLPIINKLLNLITYMIEHNQQNAYGMLYEKILKMPYRHYQHGALSRDELYTAILNDFLNKNLPYDSAVYVLQSLANRIDYNTITHFHDRFLKATRNKLSIDQLTKLFSIGRFKACSFQKLNAKDIIELLQVTHDREIIELYKRFFSYQDENEILDLWKEAIINGNLDNFKLLSFAIKTPTYAFFVSQQFDKFAKKENIEKIKEQLEFLNAIFAIHSTPENKEQATPVAKNIFNKIEISERQRIIELCEYWYGIEIMKPFREQSTMQNNSSPEGVANPKLFVSEHKLLEPSAPSLNLVQPTPPVREIKKGDEQKQPSFLLSTNSLLQNKTPIETKEIKERDLSLDEPGTDPNQAIKSREDYRKLLQIAFNATVWKDKPDLRLNFYDLVSQLTRTTLEACLDLDKNAKIFDQLYGLILDERNWEGAAELQKKLFDYVTACGKVELNSNSAHSKFHY